MAVKLRLKRIGRSKRPFYRIVAMDARTRRDGSEIERLGWFDPLRTDVAVELKEERIIHWLNQGAQPSETVDNILKEMGLKYKIHLMKEGKSEEQIATLLTQWQLRQEERRTRQIEKKEAKKETVTKAVAEEDAPSKEVEAEEESPAEEEVEAAAEEDAPSEEVEESGAEEIVEEATVKESTDKDLAEDSQKESKEESS